MSFREAGGEVSRPGVAEWEEPRHPRAASQMQSTPLRPTLQHGTRILSHFVGVQTIFGRRTTAFAGLSDVGGFVPFEPETCRGRCSAAICTRSFNSGGRVGRRGKES